MYFEDVRVRAVSEMIDVRDEYPISNTECPMSKGMSEDEYAISNKEYPMMNMMCCRDFFLDRVNKLSKIKA
jgi:hypothetical protein